MSFFFLGPFHKLLRESMFIQKLFNSYSSLEPRPFNSDTPMTLFSTVLHQGLVYIKMHEVQNK